MIFFDWNWFVLFFVLLWDYYLLAIFHFIYCALFSFFDIAAKRIMKFWTHLDFVYRWTDLYKKEQKHLENLFNLTNEVITAHIFCGRSAYFIRRL